MEAEVEMGKAGNEVGIGDTETTTPPGPCLLPRHFADCSPSVLMTSMFPTLDREGCVEERGSFN